MSSHFLTHEFSDLVIVTEWSVTVDGELELEDCRIGKFGEKDFIPFDFNGLADVYVAWSWWGRKPGETGRLHYTSLYDTITADAADHLDSWIAGDRTAELESAR